MYVAMASSAVLEHINNRHFASALGAEVALKGMHNVNANNHLHREYKQIISDNKMI